MNVQRPMITYAAHRNCPHIDCYTLSPFDKAYFLLQQIILARFLDIIQYQGTLNRHTVLLHELQESIYAQVRINQQPAMSLSIEERDMYLTIMQVAACFLPERSLHGTNAQVVDGLLQLTPTNLSITADQVLGGPNMYIPMLQSLGLAIPNDWYSDGKILNAQLAVPQIEYCQHAKNPHLRLEFINHGVVDYDINFWDREPELQNLKNTLPALFQYLFQFNLVDRNVTELIGLISNYALEQTCHSRVLPHGRNIINVPEACYRQLHAYQWYPCSQGDIPTVQAIVDTLVYLYKYHRIGISSDSGGLAILLNMIPNSAALASYFNKPAAEVTAMEAMAFRKSKFASVLTDYGLQQSRAVFGLEANTPPFLDTETEATADPNASVEEEPIPIPGSPALKSSAKASRMIIELAKDDETLADYIFRRLVSRRIRDLLANPLPQLPNTELIWLKRWLNSWVELASIRSIKDFLSRLSFKLMSLNLATDSPIGD